MDAVYHMAALHFGIADSVLWILYVISEPDAEYTQYSLCNDWFYSKQTVNSAIGTLVKLGYVRLEETNGNRNQKILKLTEQGEEFAAKTVAKVKAAEYQAFANMSETERLDFLNLTDKYLASFRNAIH